MNVFLKDDITEELKLLINNVQLVIFDFDGVFTDNRVYVSEDGIESVSCWRSDGLGLSKLKGLGLPIWVISTEINKVVSARCKKLQIDCIQGCDDKLVAVIKLVKQFDCSLDEVLYMGNDVNDIDCLQSVGLPVVVQDAYPEVVNLAKFKTQRAGGFGAVREICDLIYEFKK